MPDYLITAMLVGSAVAILLWALALDARDRRRDAQVEDDREPYRGVWQ